MTDDVVTNPGPEAEAPAAVAQASQLSIHVAFNQLPIASYPGDSADEGSVKHAPPFVRFPVALAAEDAAILENIFNSSAIALVGFEIKNADGSPRAYWAVLARE